MLQVKLNLIFVEKDKGYYKMLLYITLTHFTNLYNFNVLRKLLLMYVLVNIHSWINYK